MEKQYWYDSEHDVGYYFDLETVEIIAGERLRRQKDVETIILPIYSLINFTCGTSADELIKLAKK